MPDKFGVIEDLTDEIEKGAVRCKTNIRSVKQQLLFCTDIKHVDFKNPKKVACVVETNIYQTVQIVDNEQPSITVHSIVCGKSHLLSRKSIWQAGCRIV